MIHKGTVRFFVDSLPYKDENIIVYVAAHGKDEGDGRVVFEASCPGYPPWESYYIDDAVDAAKREIDMVSSIKFGALNEKKEKERLTLEKKAKPFNMFDLLSQATKGDRK